MKTRKKTKSFALALRLRARAATLLIALLCCVTGAWADEVTAYSSATSALRYVPVDGWNVNNYQKSEFVIPAAQLEAMDGGTISKMTFYMQTPADKVWPGNFQVFLKEVNSTTISEFYGTSEATIVYTGPLDATGSTLTITFNQGNYTYNGGNLLVGVYHIETGSGYAFTYFYGETVTGASVQGYSSSSLESVTASQQNSIPKTTFTYTPGSVAKPATLEATSVTTNSATLNWTGGTDTYNVEYKKAADANWTSAATNLTAYTYALTGLDENTEYQARVQSMDGGNVSGWKTVSFTTLTNDAVPYELSTTGIYANAATLNWTGAQNIYNMRYRSFSPAPDFVEGFEDETEFANWTVISNNTANDVSSGRLGINSAAKRSGDNGFRFSSYTSASDYNQYLISPDVSGAQSVEFYFKSSSGNEETFRVGYSTTGTTLATDFTWGDEIKSSSTTWTEFKLNLPTGVKYVAINYYSQYKYYLYIDDITIKRASAGEWVEKNGVTSPLAITGLEQDTKYQWQVQGIYNETPTDWSDMATFTTTDVFNLTANEGATGEYWATFYSDAGNYQASSGTKVFAVNLTDTDIKMTEITDGIVNKGKGVVLKNTTTSSITMTPTATDSEGDYSGNSLTGTMTSITNPNPGHTYVLGKKDGTGVGFYKLSDSGTIGANKAYLTYSGTLAREFFLFDEATGISATLMNNEEVNGEVYDLQGRRVSQPAKGLYIVNGKKYIKK